MQAVPKDDSNKEGNEAVEPGCQDDAQDSSMMLSKVSKVNYKIADMAWGLPPHVAYPSAAWVLPRDNKTAETTGVEWMGLRFLVKALTVGTCGWNSVNCSSLIFIIFAGRSW